MTKPKIFVSVSIGWAVRNYFQTGIIDRLSEQFEVVVVTTPALRREIERQGFGRAVEWIEIEPHPEALSWRLLRQLRKKIYVEGRRSHTEQLWQRYTKRPLYQRVGARFVQAFTRRVDTARLFALVERADFNVNRDAAARALFAEHEPVLLFATHASPYFDERLLRGAAAEGVPVVFMVLSWDHLSSKVLLSTRYDSILVWNDVTREEILQTYPGYRPDQIHVVGAPQFDVYAQQPALSYADWCRRWGLDPARRTLLFTTAPHFRHDQQHIVAEDLLKEMNSATALPPDLQLFIKCHPFDENPAYEGLGGRYPVAVYRPSAGFAKVQEEWIPSADELDISRDCLVHCAVNINVFSTVTLEAAYLDKPIVHLAFDPIPVTHRIPAREYYTFDHFRRIVEMGSSTMAYSHGELVAAVARYLQDPSHKRAERAALARLFVGDTVGRSAGLVRAALTERAIAVSRGAH